MDYAAHDSVYRLRKTEEAEGWFVSEKEYETKFRPPIEEVLSSGRFPLSGALLELGCGAGNFSVWLAQKGYTVSGIDISPTAISWAKERAAEQGVAVNFLLGNVLDLAGFVVRTWKVDTDGDLLAVVVQKSA